MSAVMADAQRRPKVPSAMLAVLVFIVAEVMFFAGLISAFTISKANAAAGTWPMPGEPLLPKEATAVNTGVLMLSGVLLVLAYLRFKAQKPALLLYSAAFVLGLGFVSLQGREWAGLLSQGVGLGSSTLYSFFFLIVGAHALHAVGCIAVMGVGLFKLKSGKLSRELFLATLAFWCFVVGMWPFIYGRVYF